MDMEVKNREVWVDWMRLAACFMVVVTHCTEPFYLGGEGALILTKADAFWVGGFCVFTRAAVALFVVASSYLQFPLHYSPGEFFRRRAARVLVPFLLWSLVYALVWGEPVQNLKDLLLNFNYAAGHLWFVYMLIGVYLLMPLLSPWAEKVGKKELQVYLGIWLFTTLIPFIRYWAGGVMPVIYGPSGLPNAAKYPLWGEAFWNTYGMFYYVSGFIGFLLLGLYFRRFVGVLSWKKTLLAAVPLFLGGVAIAFFGVLGRINADTHGVFPFEGPVSFAALWEGPMHNDTVAIPLMTTGLILLFRKIRGGGRFFEKVVLPVSKASYGMYLCHLLVLVPVSGWLRESLGLGPDGVLGPVWTTPVEILAASVLTFCTIALICPLVRRIPKLGEWIMG